MASDINVNHSSASVGPHTTEPPKSPRQLDVELGARIKARRKALRMSQTKLGEGLGISFQQLQKYEKGTNRVSASRLAELAAVLQVPVSHFFGDDAQSQVGLTDDNAIEAFLEDADGKRLVAAFSRIKNKTARRRMVRLVQSLAV